MNILPILASLTVLVSANPARTIDNAGLSKESLDHIYDLMRRSGKDVPELSRSKAFRSVPEVGPSSEAPALPYETYLRPKYVSPYGKLPVPAPASSSGSSMLNWFKTSLFGDPATKPDPQIEEKILRIAKANNMKVEIVRYAFREAQAQGVDYRMVLAVIEAESDFDPKAKSEVGARGLMQIMPATGRDLGVKKSADLYDPKTNIRAGTKYLKGLWNQFSNTTFTELNSLNPYAREGVQNAVAAYNAGPGAVKKYGKVPPYRETRKYVKKVLDNYLQYRGMFPEA